MTLLTSENMTPAAMALSIRWQRTVWAIRREMGFPLTPLSNETLKWTAGGVADDERGREIARIAGELGRDLVYIGWPDTEAQTPGQIALAYRDDLLIDWRDALELWAADRQSPLVLIDRQRGDRYERGERNMLVRRAGLPQGDLARGVARAAARIERTASRMSDQLGIGASLVPRGADIRDHLPPAADVVVRIN